MSNKKKVQVQYRSAKTGQFVTERAAKKHPHTTVREKRRDVEPIYPEPTPRPKKGTR
jgi:hypothetical protein